MKLYYYDHCPFCTRVRMALAFNNLSCTTHLLANDDEATPKELIGKKMLPILVKDDGEAMGESLDIVAYIDSIGKGALDEYIRPELQNVLDSIESYAAHLTMPRNTQVGYEEFATQSAQDYFVAKKTGMIGDFSANIARSGEYIAKLEHDLKALEPLLCSPGAANGESPSMEDIRLFPTLRQLTVVKGVDWPQGVHAYLEHMAQKSNVPLMFDAAV